MVVKARPGSRPRRDPGKISAGTGIPVPARFHLPGPGSLPGVHENFTNFSGNCLTFVMKLLQISHTILTNFWQIYSNLSSGAGISTLYNWKNCQSEILVRIIVLFFRLFIVGWYHDITIIITIIWRHIIIITINPCFHFIGGTARFSIFPNWPSSIFQEQAGDLLRSS